MADSRGIGGKAGLFGNLPGKTKQACVFLLVIGVLWLLTAVAVAAIPFIREPGREVSADEARLLIILGLAAAVLGVLAVTASVQLAKGRRAGKILAFCILPFTLPGLPMAILGVLALMGLIAKETREYISQQGAPQPANDPS